MKKLSFFFVICILPVKIQAYRMFDNLHGKKTLLALENEEISIVCKTGMPMAYCGFIHPSGKRYSFSGLSLDNGQCAIKINATKNDSGIWRCHIGKRTIGVEVMQNINVRVVGQITAVASNITAVHGKEITLACVTTKEKIPLRYCRFEPPNGIPFSIDSAIKPTRAILGRYFYPQNMSLDRGDCAVTIAKLKYSDVGAWTCGAGLDDGKEHTDVITLDVEGLYTMSTASSTGITFGIIFVAIVLIILGVVAWRKRRVMGASERQPEIIEIQELGIVAPASPQSQRSMFDVRPMTPGSQSSAAGRPITLGAQSSPREGRSPRLGSQSPRIPAVVVQSPSTPGSKVD